MGTDAPSRRKPKPAIPRRMLDELDRRRAIAIDDALTRYMLQDSLPPGQPILRLGRPIVLELCARMVSGVEHRHDTLKWFNRRTESDISTTVFYRFSRRYPQTLNTVLSERTMLGVEK